MLTPKSEAELAEIIATATEPLAVQGGGTRRLGAPQGQGLSTAGLTGITLYEPGALTIVARAGTLLAEIEAALAAENQRLPFEPAQMGGLLGRGGASTIGGVVAANASGPRRIQAGACRDSLIGVRFVDGRGDIIKNGGRVMKNVTGYDLVKLMAGSHGTFGVMSEVSFKVLPGVAAEATVVLSGLDDAQAVAAMSAALGSPFEVSAAAHRPDTGQTLLRVEGFESSVAYRAEQLQTLLAGFGDAALVTEGSATLWSEVRDAAPFHAAPGDVWRVSVAPSHGPSVVARSGAEAAFYDWGGGLVWLRMAEGTDLRARLSDLSGHATLIRASDATRARLGSFHPEAAPVAALSEGLRAQFDPKGLFNPGLMAAA